MGKKSGSRGGNKAGEGGVGQGKDEHETGRSVKIEDFMYSIHMYSVKNRKGKM